VTGLRGPGLIGFRISALASRGIDWPKLDETWALGGETPAFSAGWLSDHLTDASRDRGGGAFEAISTAAALAHRVPGKWIGIAVLSNTFRHPAVLAKSAVTLDNATGGRFILGLGAGWHEGEHDAFGIPLPPMAERFDRFESALRVLAALFSDGAAAEPGVTVDDSFYPLRGATMQPRPVRPGGPAIWLGGQKRRGIALAARYAVGWPLPGTHTGNVEYFVEKRDEIRRALEAVGRDAAEFTFAAQVDAGGDEASRRTARESALRFLDVGADHIILGIPATAGPSGLAAMAREVADPVAEAAVRRGVPVA
jgi:alkanesulfonate monooxygenase SsuD/methylene tetrahydromethanopterin reductase-like flavin-dependent oxidoreductase (luciferase family)